MCGIAGFWGPDAARRAQWMADLIAHRGPDDQGVWASSSVPLALANRRLKIVDLTAEGHQPMRSRDGVLHLTFNGEIFNHEALKAKLVSRGHVFRSRSDTEVLLAALAEWGTGALGMLNGMFAFALWNEQTRTLLLARDRLGIKPLYYTRVGDQFAFASEIRSLLGSGIRKPILDATHLESFLRLLWVPEPGTLFNEIWKLEPGTILTWNGVGESIVRYWDVPLPAPHVEDVPGGVNSPRALREVLERAIGRQLCADVPVGAFLSGGLDSTTILSLATSSKAREVRSYAIGFSTADRRQEGALDDLKYARLVADKLGVRHQEIILEPVVVDLLSKMVRHLEDPVADPASINCYLISQAAQATSTVLLSGTGGDELFGGYQKYVGTALGMAYQKVAGPLRRGLIEPLANRLPVSVGNIGLRPFRRAKRFLRHAGLPAFDRFAGYSCYYDADELEELLGGDPAGEIDPYLGIRPLKEAWDRRGTDDLIDRMTYVDLKYYLPGLGLAYMDKASMAASVEVRVPLLDDEVVDHVARLPGSMKVQGRKTKIALREAVRDLVPAEVLNRPKAPFTAPVRSWLRRDLAPLVDEYLGPARILSRGLLNPGVVHRLIGEHRRGIEDHSLRLWAFLTLEVWLQEFFDKAEQFQMPQDSHDREIEVTVGRQP